MHLKLPQLKWWRKKQPLKKAAASQREEGPGMLGPQWTDLHI
jgi:hypothetical protein